MRPQSSDYEFSDISRRLRERQADEKVSRVFDAVLQGDGNVRVE